VVHGVDVALLGQHRFMVGRHQQRTERMTAHGDGAQGHGVGAPQQRHHLRMGWRGRLCFHHQAP